MITYTQKQLRDFFIAASKEWLLTDGDGGYACSTISFLNTRRQHSLLTTSTSPPLKRFTLLNKVDEEVLIEGKSYMLATNQYPGTVFPEGYKLQSRFVFDHFPQVTFDLDGHQLTKKVLMPKGAGTIYLHYDNDSKKTMTIRLLPLISFRWKDSLRKAGDGFLVDELPDGVRIISEMNLPRLYLKLSRIYATSPESYWYYDFIYSHDSSIYKEDREDLFNIGFWETELEPGKGLTLAASTRDLAEFDYNEIEARHIESVENTRKASGLPKRYVHLADSASNHLSRSRVIRGLAIINGFPYGGVSVRESLLSLEGISCVSGKEHFEHEFFNDLVTNEVGGMLPSTMDEMTTKVNYDDPRIPLYLAVALKRHVDKEGNADWLRRYLPIMENAVETILQVNLGAARIKESGLIDMSGGKSNDLQTTVENAVVNALWYNLLKVVDEAKSEAEPLSSYAEAAAEIERGYFEHFFSADGTYKGLERGGELVSDMALPLVIPFSPLNARQREEIFKSLVTQFLDSYGKPHPHSVPAHACNLMAIYLAEAGAMLESHRDETSKLGELLTELFTLHDFTNCLNGLPRCTLDPTESNPQDLSSSVVTAEAIRVIKKLKFR